MPIGYFYSFNMSPTAPESISVGPSIQDHPTESVVAIGTNQTNADLLEATAHSAGCLFDSVTSSEGIDEVLADPHAVSLAVVDVRSVTSRVQRLCRRLHEQDISVLLLTTHLSPTFESELRHTPGLTVHKKPTERAELEQVVRSLTLAHR
ncbi:hypothetical protein SAMN04487950_0194 [Halogranum rubrum]|uniref:Response regulatory domain-containing protein n=2 Tax=Halogranum rubrum TaxID=553466 RepID=A0A1I4B0B6_9EURY|nr:hypothetical protein SAMN04487950_0194 [Halogranum rubrum]